MKIVDRLVLVVFGIYLFVKPVNSFINQMVHYLSMLDLDSLKEYILSLLDTFLYTTNHREA